MKRLLAFLLLLCCCLLPVHAWAAASFVATLSDEEIGQGDGVTLTLSLTDAQPRENPDVDALKPLFELRAQKRVADVMVVDGQMSQVMRWHYELLPKRAGRLTVPGFHILTDRGQMTSRPIYLTVNSDPAAARARAQAHAQVDAARAPRIKIDAAYSDQNPLLGQAVVLNVDLLRGNNVLEAVLQQPSGSGLRVQRIGTPKNEFVRLPEGNFTRSNVQFAVTGIEAGAVRLDPVPLSGTVFNMFTRDADLFNGLDDPADLINRMMRQNGISEPFKQELETPTLNVRPIPPNWTHGLRAWLPAWSVSLNQRAEGLQNAKTGEPIMREITLIASGVMPENLPKLEPLLRAGLDENEWQLYPGEPETNMQPDPDHHTVVSYVTQKFTYVPLKEGPQELPGLTIPWWNLATQAEQSSTLEPMPFDAAKGSGTYRGPETAKTVTINPGQEEATPARDGAPISWVRVFWLSGLTLLVGAAWYVSKFRRLPSLPASLRKPAATSTRLPARPTDWKAQLAQATDAAAMLKASARAMPRPDADESLSHLAERLGQPQLAALLKQLEAAAYGRSQQNAGALKAPLQSALEQAMKAMQAQTKIHKPEQDIWTKLNG